MKRERRTRRGRSSDSEQRHGGRTSNNRRFGRPEEHPSDHEFIFREKHRVWKFLLGTVIFLTSYSILWSIAHLILRSIAKVTPIQGTLREYLTLILTFFLFGSVMIVIRIVLRPDQRATQAMNTVVDAMQRMSKGDFNVNVEVHPRYVGQFYGVVDNLNRMAAELGQLDSMRQQFVADVSHEIQSPLTSIRGFAKALQQDSLTYEQRMHYSTIIDTESGRLSRLSDNLLKLSTLESAHPPYQPKKFRLDRQLREVVLAIEPQWQAKRIQFNIELDQTEMEADVELLRQVWVNLIGNAIKFTPDDGLISIGLTSDKESVHIEIKDSGIGIAQEDLPRLFERFYKADKSRNRTFSGNGLGLSIVHKIIQIHQGQITVLSELGQGATFKVSLPKFVL